jgi:cell division protein FtsQ
VLISVDERKLMAVWQHDGRTGVIDTDGVVAPEADPGRFAGLPLVVGEGANDTAQTILGPVMARPRLAQRLDALVRVDQRRWDLRLKDGSIVQLPAADQDGALVKLDQLDQQSRILDLGFSRIDLRDPEMVAVRPRQAPAAMGADGAG